MPKTFRMKFCRRVVQSLLAVLCMLLLALGDTAVYAQPARQDSAADEATPKIPSDQLDSLVAPIALYPDPLLSQVLVASTYPLEIIQLQQWLEKHKDLNGDALVAAVEKEDWDPSIQAMAALPDAVKQLAENIKWTTDLGNAFLAQQSDVMDAVQRMRMKAKNAGNLKSTPQLKVETESIETKPVIVIQQANPQVVYVPSYNPVVVYGPPVYPYPPIYYPPPGYWAGAAVIGFGVGVAVGTYWRGGWGYGCGWGRSNNVNININNNYINRYNRTNINANRNNINNSNRINGNGRPSQLPANKGNTWQHNPQHRGGAPYSNKQVANKYGGTARGDSVSTRQANARQQQGSGNRQQPGANNRGTAPGNRGGSNAGASPGNIGANRGNGAGNRAGSNAGASPGNMGANRGNAAGNRAGSNASSGTGNMGANHGNGAGNRAGSNAGARPGNTGANSNGSGGNKIGNRQAPSSNASRNTGAFGGASSKAGAQASSARGASSMGASRGSGRPARSGGGGRRN